MPPKKVHEASMRERWEIGMENGEIEIGMKRTPLSAPLRPTTRIPPADTRPSLLVYTMIDLQAVYQSSTSYLNNPIEYPIDDLQFEGRRVEMFFGASWKIAVR